MNKKSFFWASYADLMTSLFFIMLVLFILTVIMLNNAKEATESQLEKVKEIEAAVNNIDTTLFEYKSDVKKHILKIDVSFPKNEHDMSFVSSTIQQKLRHAGNVIKNFIDEAHVKYGIEYLVIIEGQASKDNFPGNYEISYARALALYKFWKNTSKIEFDPKACEVVISGSGQDGSYRAQPDNASNTANQRFLIHIVPKPGIIESINKR